MASEMSSAPRWTRYGVALAGESRTMRQGYAVALAVIVAVGLALRAWELHETDVWTDEIHTLLRLHWPVADALRSTLNAANQTPLYYLLLKLLPGDSLLWVRGVSVFFGLVSVVAFSEVVVYLYGSRLTGLGLAALLAVHPMSVILGRTARYYTLLLVVCLAVSVTFVLLLRGQHSRRLWTAFTLSSMFAYALHYTALGLPASQLVVLIIAGRTYRPLWRRWASAQAIAVAPLLLWYLTLLVYWFTPWLGGSDPARYPYLGQQISAIDLPISVMNVIFGFDGRWSWLLLPAIVGASGALISGVALIIRRRGAALIDYEWLYWAVLAASTFVGLFGLAAIVGAQYRDRYYIVSMPAVLILVGMGLRRLGSRVGGAALGVIVITALALTLSLFHAGEHERTDWSAAGSYISANFAPGDQVIFERPLMFEAFKVHYRGQPEVLDAAVFLRVEDDPLLVQEVLGVEPPADRLWVVYRQRHEDLHRQDWQYVEPLTPHLSPTSDWLLARQDRIVGAHSFRGLKLFLVGTPINPEPELPPDPQPEDEASTEAQQ